MVCSLRSAHGSACPPLSLLPACRLSVRGALAVCQSRAGSSGGPGLLALPLRVTAVGTWKPGGVGLAGCLAVPCVPEGFAEQDVFLPCPERRHRDHFSTGARNHSPPSPLSSPLSPQGCAANFSSLMGYQYHQKRCGKQLAEADKPVFSCPHCGKKYKSKAGHDYHVRSEHPASVSPPDTSAARGAGPSLPVGDCRAAEPVGRTEPGRAGPGKAGADVGLMLFSPFSSPHACVVPCSVGGERATAPLAHSEKQGAVFKRGEWQAVFPSTHGAAGLCSSRPCSRGLQKKKKKRDQITPSAASKRRLLAAAGVAGCVPGEHPFLCC